MPNQCTHITTIRPFYLCNTLSASASVSKLFNLVWSPIVTNPVQSSPSIFWTESQRRSLSLALWRSPIRMPNSYAHMRESTESIAAFFVYFCFCFCFRSSFPCLVHQFSHHSVLPFLLSSSPNHRLESGLALSEQSPHVRINEPHE
jgi:hypothetical protein